MRQRFTLAGRLAHLSLFTAACFGAVQSIDCGSVADTGFSAGAWLSARAAASPTVSPIRRQAVSDATLRYCVSCSYTIPTTEGQPYIVTLNFVETSVAGPFQRLFSVSINDQPVLVNFDVFAAAGYLTPIQRSFVAVPNNGQLVIAFSASVRNAVISSIQVSPLFVLSAHTSGLLRLDAAGVPIIIGVKATADELTAPGWVAQVPTDVLRMFLGGLIAPGITGGGVY